MNPPSPDMRELARRILVGSKGAEAACGALSATLTSITGPDGCSSLVCRALVLAREEAPELEGVRVGPQGIDGLAEVASGDGGQAAAVAMLAHLLALLVVFVGEQLTMRLVHQTWPDADFDVLKPRD